MRALPAALLPLLAACSTHLMRDAAPVAVQPDQAKVVVYRPSTRSRARLMPVYDGERLMGFVEPRCAFDYLCPPGAHLFIIHGTSDIAVEAELEAGRTYYLKVGTEPDWFRRRVVVVPVVSGSAEAAELGNDLAECISRALDADAGADYAEDAREKQALRRAWFEGDGKAERLTLRRDDGQK